MHMPSNIKRLALEGASLLGLGNQATLAYDRLTAADDYEVDSQIAEYSLLDDEVKGYVLLPTVEGANRNAYRTYIIGHAFRTRGYRPIVPLCNADLELCMRKSPEWDSDAICHTCNYHGKKMASAFGFDQLDLSELLLSEDEYDIDAFLGDDPSTYRGIDVFGFAQASTRKFFRKYHISTNDTERDVLRRFLTASCQLVDAFYTLFEEYDIKTCFTNDPVYVYGGIPLAVAEAQGVVGYSSSRAYRDRACLFGRTSNTTWLPQFEDPDFLASLVSQPLTDEQRDEIDRVMEGRKTGEHTRVHYSSQESTSVEQSESGSLAAMFTNLIWDASIVPGDAAYDEVFEWIGDTIEWFCENSDQRLVIKLHPAEEKFGTNERVGEWISDQYGPLPDNIDMLPPETDVNTYELLNTIDVAVVYNSTVGFEMAYNGGPVVVAGSTHYRDLGFTFDPSSKDHYFDLLGRLDELELSETAHTRAVRYVYHLLITRHVTWPYSRTNEDTGNVELLPVSHDELTPGNPLFDHIVDQSLSGGPIVSPDATQFLDT